MAVEPRPGGERVLGRPVQQPATAGQGSRVGPAGDPQLPQQRRGPGGVPAGGGAAGLGVAGGRSNREIAAELFASVSTVEAHLTRIYRRLDLRRRTELTTWYAAER